jgi:hypothetical protein
MYSHFIMTFPSFHFPTFTYPSHPQHNVLPFSSLPFTSLHFTSLHLTSLHFTALFDDLLSESKNERPAMTEKCVDQSLFCSVSCSNSRSAATSYINVYIPALQDMLKMFRFASDIFTATANHILAQTMQLFSG